MAASQNGWKANDRSLVSSRLVPGTDVKLTVRNGAPGDLLLEAAAMFDRTVMDIDNGRAHLNDWGYAERPVRGGTDLSNHASGTADDLEADELPLGKTKTSLLTGPQIEACERITDLTILPGGKRVLRWGGDYDDPSRGGRRGGRPDVMHWELNDGTNEADCVAALAQLRAAGPGTPATSAAVLAAAGGMLVRGSKGPAVAKLQRVIAAWRPDLGLKVDQDFGEKTEAAVRAIQAGSHGVLAVDGRAGPATLRFLGMA